MPPRAPFLLVPLALLVAGCASPAASPDEEDPLDAVRQATKTWSTPDAAEAAGYEQYSPYVEHHGMHFRNKAYANGVFDPATPPVLTFVRDANGELRLGAVEYSLPRVTNVAPEGFPGAADVWGVHEASCHFTDGLQFPENDKAACPAVNPITGAEFLLWHDYQWTLHVWLHKENPDGMFKPANPAIP